MFKKTINQRSKKETVDDLSYKSLVILLYGLAYSVSAALTVASVILIRFSGLLPNNVDFLSGFLFAFYGLWMGMRIHRYVRSIKFEQ